MRRRLLVALNGSEVSKELNDSILYLKNQYDFEVTGVYVKELEEKFAYTGSYAGKGILEEYRRLESEIVDKIKANKNKLGLDRIVVREGAAINEIPDEMLAYDLLMIDGKRGNEYVIKSFVKYHFKPMIIVKEKAVNFDSVFLSNDKGASVNRSVFSFVNIFDDVKELKSICVNNRVKRDGLADYFEGSSIDYTPIPFEGDPGKIMSQISKDNSFMIMGSLAHTNFLETLGGHYGLKILEGVKTSVFIG